MADTSKYTGLLILNNGKMYPNIYLERKIHPKYIFKTKKRQFYFIGRKCYRNKVRICSS